MIQRISDLRLCQSFLEGFCGDPLFGDPHLAMMKEKGEDIDAFLRRPNHLGFAISKEEAVVGLFLFIVIPDESYIEMYVGISKDEDAVEEMLDYLEKTYPGYRADFVFNPNWKIFREGLLGVTPSLTSNRR